MTVPLGGWVVVAGSLAADLAVQVERRLEPDETVLGCDDGLRTIPLPELAELEHN